MHSSGELFISPSLLLLYLQNKLLSNHINFRAYNYYDSVQDGFTALMVAAQNGHCGVVGMLLEAKADVNIRSNVSDIYRLCLCTSIAASRVESVCY